MKKFIRATNLPKTRNQVADFNSFFLAINRFHARGSHYIYQRSFCNNFFTLQWSILRDSGIGTNHGFATIFPEGKQLYCEKIDDRITTQLTDC
jgi:hypothetical protein